MTKSFTKAYSEMNKDELITALNYLNDKKNYFKGNVNRFRSTYDTVCALNLITDEEIKECEETLNTVRTVVECYSREISFVEYLLVNRFNYEIIY